MRKVIFTAIVLIVLGTAWTLYLEYDKKRFIDSLPQPPTTVTQPVSTADAPANSKSIETTATESAPSETIIEDTLTESEHAHPHPHTHTDSLEPTEEVEIVFEERLSEVEITSNPTQPPPNSSEVNESLAFFLEEERVAMETLERITMNPKNWVRGQPGEVGFVIALTDADWEASAEANYVLNPTEENRKALENARIPRAQLVSDSSPKGYEVIQIGSYTIHMPIR